MKTRFVLLLLVLLPFTLSAPDTTAAAQGNQIDYGMTVEEILTSRMPQHAWVFRGSQGDVVTIEMNAVSDPDFTGLDTRLILEFEDGTFLAEDDDGGEETNSRIDGFRLPEDGDYVIIATSFSGEEAGRYRLSLERVESASRRIEYLGQLGYGQRVEAELAPDVAAHVWEFLGGEGDEISIAMNALGAELDPFVLLLRMTEGELEAFFSLSEEELRALDAVAEEYGVLLAFEDDREEDRNAFVPAFVLPADGPYVIMASSCCTAGSSGPYELILDFGGAQPQVGPGGGQPLAQTAVPPAPPSPPPERGPRVPPYFWMFLVGVSGAMMWRWVRSRLGPPATEPPVEPVPMPPDVRFKHGWDPPSHSIDSGRRALKADIDIRFRLRLEQNAQYVEGYESSLIG